jgi:muramoyltetrapeptide carboxypeptidase
MKIIKPKALQKNDLIGICAPASPPKSKTSLTKGIDFLERIGFQVQLGKHVFCEYGYLAGEDKQRAEDFNNLVSNKNVKAIFFARGGYGSSRILPLIDYDNLKRNPKIIVGYSDITALQLAIFKKSGLITVAGPMVEPDFSKIFSGKSEELFWELLTSKLPIGDISKFVDSDLFAIRDGCSTGRLLGGNLSVLSSLVGTKFLPSFTKSVLVLEDVDEAPYRIDRMLHQLKYSGVLSNLSGVLLGDFSSCKPEVKKPSLTLRQIYDNVFPNYPIVSNLHFGHARNPISLPYGILIKMDTRKQKLIILESAVT